MGKFKSNLKLLVCTCENGSNKTCLKSNSICLISMLLVRCYFKERNNVISCWVSLCCLCCCIVCGVVLLCCLCCCVVCVVCGVVLFVLMCCLCFRIKILYLNTFFCCSLARIFAVAQTVRASPSTLYRTERSGCEPRSEHKLLISTFHLVLY